MQTETKERRTKWSRNLYQMRGPGKRRRHNPSASLLPLLERLPDSALVIDLGCGESNDALIARDNGLRAYGLDVFPPSHPDHFIQADALALPLADNSTDGIVSHAMISLLAPFDRWEMFSEIARVLKPSGLFSMTPYNLADGWSVKVKLEDDRAFQNGLHLVKRGLYQKCDDDKCTRHPPLDTWEALRDGIYEIDVDADFRHVAPVFVAWIMHAGCKIAETCAFTGASEKEVKDIVRGAIAASIFDPKDGSLELPWLDDFMEDRNLEGNIGLIFEVLAVRGEVERSKNSEGEILYKLVK